jgi:hypothetical protein
MTALTHHARCFDPECDWTPTEGADFDREAARHTKATHHSTGAWAVDPARVARTGQERPNGVEPAQDYTRVISDAQRG